VYKKLSFISIFCLFCLWSCVNSRQSSAINTPIVEADLSIQVLSATYNRWRAGVESGGAGIKIIIQCIITGTDVNRIDSVYIDSIHLPVFIARKIIEAKNDAPVFVKGDTIHIHAESRKGDANWSYLSTQKSIDQVELVYHSNNKRSTIVIDSLKEIRNINQP
jgi:hypothetical protein